MPFDALVVSVAITAVFVGFALVLAWADRRTRQTTKQMALKRGGS